MNTSKLLANTVADQFNGILRNIIIAVSLSYLNNFGESPEMSLISFKLELKLKWMKHCLFTSAGTEDADANSDIIFTIKETKLCVPVNTLSANDNQRLKNSKLLGKKFERSLYRNEYKTKSEIKDTTNEYRWFLESNFVGVSRLCWFIQIKINYTSNILFTKGS